MNKISFKGVKHDLASSNIRDARKAFESISKEIRQGLIRYRRNQKKHVGRTKLASKNGEYIESSNDWLKRNAYRLIRLVIENGKAQIFEDIIEAGNRHKVGLYQIRDHPFKMGLFAMFSDPHVFSRTARQNFADQMLYAHRHGVPSKYLNAFVAKAGKPEVIREKLENGLIFEPGFNIRSQT